MQYLKHLTHCHTMLDSSSIYIYKYIFYLHYKNIFIIYFLLLFQFIIVFYVKDSVPQYCCYYRHVEHLGKHFFFLKKVSNWLSCKYKGGIFL